MRTAVGKRPDGHFVWSQPMPCIQRAGSSRTSGWSSRYCFSFARTSLSRVSCGCEAWGGGLTFDGGTVFERELLLESPLQDVRVRI